MVIRKITYAHFSYESVLDLYSEKDYMYLLFRNAVSIFWSHHTIDAKAGCLVLLRPNQSVTAFCLGDCFLLDLLEFYPHQVDFDLMHTLELPQSPCVPPNLPELSAIIGNIADDYYSPGSYSAEEINAYFHLLLYCTASGDEKIDSLSRSDLIHHKMRRLRVLVSDDPSSNWTVDAAAQFVNLSVSRFSYLYKETFGITFMNDVIRSRIKRSCFLLNITDDSIDEIAKKLGYRNETFFYRQFKKQMHCSPGEYRRENIMVL